MSSTHPQPQPATTESPSITSSSDIHRETDTEAAATFDTTCRRRLACLIDAENGSVSPAYSARHE